MKTTINKTRITLEEAKKNKGKSNLPKLLDAQIKERSNKV